MRVRTVGTLAALASLAAVTAFSARPAPNPDEDAIRQVIQYYFNTDSSVAKAFHPDARMLFVRDGKFQLVEIEAYIARRFEAAAKRTSTWTSQRIVSVDVAGTAAVAKLELRNDQSAVTDYMSLLKTDGQWLIVNKIFDRQMKAAGTP